MASFPITKKNGVTYRVLVDEEDYERVLALDTWWVNTFATTQTVYARGGNTGVYLHRFLLNAPKGTLVDHINTNGLDCRKENLRVCTHAENTFNRGKTRVNTSGYKGVTWDKARSLWLAQIKAYGKHHYLGHYENPELAYEAYCQAAITLHGRFARTA